MADKGKREAMAKHCIYINDAEPKTPKTHATTKCCKHRNDANTQNTCNREKHMQQLNAANIETMQTHKTHAIEKCCILSLHNGSVTQRMFPHNGSVK